MPVEDPGGVLEAGPDRQTRVIGGNGTQSLSTALAPGLFQYVESVLVQVTNGGGDAQPELTIATANGTVIATQRQDDVIPAGDTGAATFALRIPAKKSLRGFLKWGTNTDPFGFGLTLISALGALDIDVQGIDVDTNGQAFLTDTNGGVWQLQTGGAQVDIRSQGGDVDIDSNGGDIDITADAGFTAIRSNNGSVTVEGGGTTIVRIGVAGQKFEVRDATDTVVFSVTG